MGKIEWEEFKGKFPKEGIYFVKFLHEEQEDYATMPTTSWVNRQRKRFASATST